MPHTTPSMDTSRPLLGAVGRLLSCTACCCTSLGLDRGSGTCSSTVVGPWWACRTAGLGDCRNAVNRCYAATRQGELRKSYTTAWHSLVPSSGNGTNMLAIDHAHLCELQAEPDRRGRLKICVITSCCCCCLPGQLLVDQCLGAASNLPCRHAKQTHKGQTHQPFWFF